MSGSISPGSSDLELGEDEIWIVPGHLKKRIVNRGSGSSNDQPRSGAEVQVHYIGRLLNGKEFDSSRGRGEPFSFKVGKGSVIKGWDEGIPSMTIGERSIFTMSPSYGYGASGSPPSIPPNSVLTFDVELLSFDSYENVGNDGTVRKQIIKASSGYTKPNEGSKVTIHLTLALKNEPTKQLIRRMEDSPLVYTVGEDINCITGVEEAIKSMYNGEHSLFSIKSTAAYGAKGYQISASNNNVFSSSCFPLPSIAVPPDADLIANIDLIKVEKAKDTWAMSETEKQAAIIKQKEIGNLFFKSGQLSRAKSKYSSALQLITPIGETDANPNKQTANVNKGKEARDPSMIALKLPLLTNLALVSAKQFDYGQVIKYSQEALELQSDNVKALVRLAQAYAELDEPAKAEENFKRALDIELQKPSLDSELLAQIKKEIVKVSIKLNAAKKKERKMFGGFFSKLNLVDEKEEQTRKEQEESNKKRKEEKVQNLSSDEENEEEEKEEEGELNGTAASEVKEKKAVSGLNPNGNPQGTTEASG